jgi:hypothetical protein
MPMRRFFSGEREQPLTLFYRSHLSQSRVAPLPTMCHKYNKDWFALGRLVFLLEPILLLTFLSRLLNEF